MNYNFFHELKIKHVMRFQLRPFGTLLKNTARLIKNLYNQKHFWCMCSVLGLIYIYLLNFCLNVLSCKCIQASIHCDNSLFQHSGCADVQVKWLYVPIYKLIYVDGLVLFVGLRDLWDKFSVIVFSWPEIPYMTYDRLTVILSDESLWIFWTHGIFI